MLATLLASAAGLAPAANAANRVYWSNYLGNTIAFAAHLNGNGPGGTLATTGATAKTPSGVALDVAAGRIYWANRTGNTISFAKLDGSGAGGDLNTAGATMGTPIGVAIDPAAGRIYWANNNAGKISYANLNGSGGDDIDTTGATVNKPFGVAIDPAGDRIYWANSGLGVNKISFASLKGSGGGDLSTAGATVNFPNGVAIDSAAGRIYWANYLGGTISFARLDGGGGGDLSTAGATIDQPSGVAIDAAAGRIYWANATTPGKISYAKLNGTGGGGSLTTTGATLNSPQLPAVLKAPVAAGSPAITGGPQLRSVLSCSAQGAWAPDLLGAFLYRAPASYAFQWTRNGADIAGAQDSKLTADVPGAYRCRVTAANLAGNDTQTSGAITVVDTIVPRYLSVVLSPRSFSAYRSGPSVRPARTRGTTITYRLSEAAAATFRVERALTGRRVGGRCVRTTRANRTRRACQRFVLLPGSFRQASTAGLNAFRFTGRLAGRALAPGGYRLVAVAADTAGNRSKPQRRLFQIVQ